MLESYICNLNLSSNSSDKSKDKKPVIERNKKKINNKTKTSAYIANAERYVSVFEYKYEDS